VTRNPASASPTASNPIPQAQSRICAPGPSPAVTISNACALPAGDALASGTSHSYTHANDP
jgi:hypothetical protein